MVLSNSEMSKNISSTLPYVQRVPTKGGERGCSLLGCFFFPLVFNEVKEEGELGSGVLPPLPAKNKKTGRAVGM